MSTPAPRTQWQTWSGVALIAVVGAACSGGGAGVAASNASPPSATLEFKKGQVSLQRAGKTVPAELGYLYVKDAIETGAGAEATIRFPGDRVIEIGPDARLVIGEDKTGIVLEVARGLVLSRTPAPAPGNFGGTVMLSISTPFGLTRLGSTLNEVSVVVGKDSANIEVRVGTVAFVSRDGQTRNANAGDTLVVTLGSAEFTHSAPPPSLVLEPIQVILLSTSGRTEVKKKDARTWVAVRKAGAELSAGEGVRVKDGSSVLQFPESTSRFTLNKGAEIVFDKSERGNGLEQSSLTLTRGDLLGSLAADRKSQLRVGGLELVSDAGGQFTLVKTADGVGVTSLTGDLLLRSNGAEVALRAGQTATVPSEGAPKVEAAGRRELVLPSRQGLRVFHSGLEALTLAWSGEAHDYKVEVATDRGFSDKLLSGVVHQAQVDLPAPRQGALFWRITEADGGKEVDSGSAVFQPEAADKELGRVRNEVPEGTEKTTIYYQDKPPAVTFTYRPEPNAAAYRLRVYKENALDKPVVERSVKEERLPLEAGILVEGNYIWEVMPLSSTGVELRGGKTSQLELAYDNAVPNLVIRSPRNGELLVGNTIEVAGVAPVGARVFVNGRPVTLDEKARFQASVAPTGKPPLVIFRMVPSSGPEVFTVRTLRRGK